MAGVNRLEGTPWHVETLRSDDDRRHRARCKHYCGKPSDRCVFFNEKCHGSTHCAYYCEKVEFHKLEDFSTQKKSSEDKKKAFTGVKSISMTDIVLKDKFINTPPKQSKIERVMKFYQENGRLDKPVVVACKGNKYLVVDNYLRYVVAKKLGLKELPAEMGTKDELKQYDLLRTEGTLVWHKRDAEVGEVIKADCTKTTIRFDSGKECSFSIHECLKAETIRIL